MAAADATANLPGLSSYCARRGRRRGHGSYDGDRDRDGHKTKTETRRRQQIKGRQRCRQKGQARIERDTQTNNDAETNAHAQTARKGGVCTEPQQPRFTPLGQRDKETLRQTVQHTPVVENDQIAGRELEPGFVVGISHFIAHTFPGSVEIRHLIGRQAKAIAVKRVEREARYLPDVKRQRPHGNMRRAAQGCAAVWRKAAARRNVSRSTRAQA